MFRDFSAEDRVKMDRLIDIQQVLSDNRHITTTVALAGVSTALILYYFTTKSKVKYPPGPTAWPVLGNIPQILRAGPMEVFLEQCRRIYGNAMNFLEFIG